MESYKIKDLSFTYAAREKKSLDNICLEIEKGDFVCICGRSGCGKTTLLRLLKPALSPHGEIHGEILFEGKPLSELSQTEQASKIGFVLQNPENQIVTDKVWHELAFGAENLGLKQDDIRARVSEMATFFGIEDLFHSKTSELSGGQKQIISLASIMVMQPECLILDEPTSQLDPIAAQDFLKTLEKINRETGTTIIISEHRLEDVMPIASKVIVLEEGKVIASGSASEVGAALKEANHDMFEAMPTPMKIYGSTNSPLPCPVTVRDGRIWLDKHLENVMLKDFERHDICCALTQKAIELKGVWFRYEKNSRDIIKGIDFKAKKGELAAIVGGNGAGKSTLLSVMAELKTPYRGKIWTDGSVGMLPQNPEMLFTKKTLYQDLLEALDETGYSKEQKDLMIDKVASLCKINSLYDFHPYDLSGGEKQRAALAKVLLTKPDILLMDEPTKGMDAAFKTSFAKILTALKMNGICIVMVSHDIEFCAKNADKCALLFDGKITSMAAPREFFAGKSFYTTAANRMARQHIPDAVLTSDVIEAIGGKE